MTPFPLTIIHLGQPLPASRHRTGRGHGYHLPAYTAYKTALAWAMRQAVGPRHVPDRGPWGVTLMFYRNRRDDCDGDNLEKGVLDAGAKVIWSNDRYVKRCQWEVGYDKAHPRVEIRVEMLSDAP